MLRNAREICMYFERMRIDGLLLAFTFANPCKYMRCRKNSLAHVTYHARNRCMTGAFKSLNFFSNVKVFLKFGKILRRQRHILLEQGPIETRSRILFAAGGNVLVSCNIPNGVMLCQRFAKLA